MMHTFQTRLVILISWLLCSIWITSCLSGDNSLSPNQEASNQLLLERAQSFDELSTFVEKVEESNLESAISDSGAYMLFAPSNEAFAQLSEGILDTLSTEELTNVLSYHVTDTALFANQFRNTQRFETLQGENIYLFRGTNTININLGQLIAGNYQAQNGILHATNTVLLPDSYLNVTGIFGKRYTLFTFNQAIGSTELSDTLQQSEGNEFTVFAPTNTAFNSTSPPEDESAIESLLEYHIIPQKLTSSDFEGSQSFETLNGDQLTVEVQNDEIIVDGEATITTSNLEGTNGIVHIVDAVLTPPDN
jgi:transforming growth factor-beta-induced protein